MSNNKQLTNTKFTKDKWTHSQAKQLEAALLSVEKDFADWNEETLKSYWNAIAKQVAGKGAAQCLYQYQTLRQKLREMSNNSPKSKAKAVLTPSQILKKKKKPTTSDVKPTKPTKPIKPATKEPSTKKVPKNKTSETKVSAPAVQSTPPTPPAAVPTKTPTPWTPEEHLQLENALKEFQGVEDKREKWRLIAVQVPTRKASQCLLKYKQMRKAIKESSMQKGN